MDGTGGWVYLYLWVPVSRRKLRDHTMSHSVDGRRRLSYFVHTVGLMRCPAAVHSSPKEE